MGPPVGTSVPPPLLEYMDSETPASLFLIQSLRTLKSGADMSGAEGADGGGGVSEPHQLPYVEIRMSSQS